MYRLYKLKFFHQHSVELVFEILMLATQKTLSDFSNYRFLLQRQTAVIEILQHAFRNARGNMEEFQKKCATALIGAMVLTR